MGNPVRTIPDVEDQQPMWTPQPVPPVTKAEHLDVLYANMEQAISFAEAHLGQVKMAYNGLRRAISAGL
jgi:hypothetical protein